MYFIMDTPLNLAHWHQRKADNLLRRGNYDESINHHQKAAELLSQALEETTSSSAQESLKFQIEYHSRQQLVVKNQQKCAERRREIIERKQIEEKKFEPMPTKTEKPVSKEIVQKAINTMIERDALLSNALKNVSGSPDNSLSFGRMSYSFDSAVKIGVKSPKDDKMRLEELRGSNADLKYVLLSLVTELENCNAEYEKCCAENEQLRKSLEELQKIHEHCPISANTTQFTEAVQNPQRQYFSPLADLRNVSEFCDLPALAPIEMPPKFNFYQE